MKVFKLEGLIDWKNEEFERLIWELRQCDDKKITISINSMGGNHTAFEDLVTELKRFKKVYFHIGNTCMSAASYLLNYGIIKSVNKTSRLGFHTSRYYNIIVDYICISTYSLDDEIKRGFRLSRDHLKGLYEKNILTYDEYIQAIVFGKDIEITGEDLYLRVHASQRGKIILV